jgi:TRAP-type C4-dicarboxylate transport system substrate-binding protein
MILDGHTLGAIQVIITDEAWDKLSAKQQNALVEAGKIASKFNRELSEGAEQDVLKQLAAEGAVVVEVTDVKPWQAACTAIIKESSAKNAALYQKILDMQ